MRSRVLYEPHYSVTGLDAPETMNFIRECYPQVKWVYPKQAFFKAFETNGYPQRDKRWCCRVLKEGVRGGIIIQGIRWQESPGKRGKRRVFEVCHQDKLTFFLNPIIDWTDKEVWEYIHKYDLPYCSLYDEGFKRLGCILCPMGTAKQAQIQIKRFPKQAEAWHRAFLRKFDEATWQHWLTRKGQPKVNDAQCVMFDN
jgi:phosphoadenosine phosphosulfate reductase